MAQAEPQTLDELKALPKTSNPVELARRKKIEEKLMKKLTEQGDLAARMAASTRERKEREKKEREARARGQAPLNQSNNNGNVHDDINHIHVEDNGQGSGFGKHGKKRSHRQLHADGDHKDDGFDDINDINVNSDGSNVVPHQVAPKKKYDGKVEGPNGAINAITQKWMDNEISDEKYQNLLGTLKSVKGAGDDGAAAVVPARKRRKKNGSSHNGGSSIVCIIHLYFHAYIFCFY